MKQAQLDALIAELGGKDARESVTAWFMPSFHPECGVVLVRDGTGWRGWWVATLRVPGGDPVLRWLDPTTSREPLPLAEGDINALVRQVREACRTEPAKSGEIILDGCVFRLDVRTGAEAVVRSAHLSHRGESLVRSLATTLCDHAEAESRWEATQNAFSGLRGYLA